MKKTPHQTRYRNGLCFKIAYNPRFLHVFPRSNGGRMHWGDCWHGGVHVKTVFARVESPWSFQGVFFANEPTTLGFKNVQRPTPHALFTWQCDAGKPWPGHWMRPYRPREIRGGAGILTSASRTHGSEFIATTDKKAKSSILLLNPGKLLFYLCIGIGIIMKLCALMLG